MHLSDTDLIRRCQAGDRQAFNALIRRYQHAVYGWCYHFTQDFAEAQDLTQETFVRATPDSECVEVPRMATPGRNACMPDVAASAKDTGAAR